ncbi:adenosylcobinamide-GDP ribazoletransferase [Synechococcus sp. RSCCF101]|uniref:adenosylcobinamide-GDP ribazoletransferase n=1 Tax=Synechococcus sp. RSCCF101 TaxID=2511069 RepID=UPI001CD95815|nr:adenosylcobinamide-GDP ribazoletransferase [Synechococcus sp. RSCCF101]
MTVHRRRRRLLSPPDWCSDLAGAWIFYTVLPAWPWPAPRFRRIARFAPLLGLVTGGAQALLWWALTPTWPLAARVALVLTLGLWISGGIHADGLMDTADGLAAPKASRLAAMDDSRVGAAGVIAMIQVLLLRAAGLWMLDAAAPAALLAAAVWGRWSPLLAIDRFPYLREDGTAGFHRDHWRGLRRESRPMLALLVVCAVGIGARGWPWWLLVGALPASAVPLILGRRLEGHSGDSYGACVEWSESLALLLMGLLACGV